MHAYSAGNRGDGLLVEEAVGILREAYGNDVSIVLVARDPSSFSAFPVTVLPSLPSLEGVRHVATVARAAREADVVVSVGGGYARGDTASAFMKYAVVHLTQTVMAGRSPASSVYLPQSVGPFHPIIWPLIRAAYRRIGIVALRDDRSVTELGLTNARRVPDSAILSLARPAGDAGVDQRPVLSVRKVSSRAWSRVERLARSLDDFDGYVQSSTLGNDDRPEMQKVGAARILQRDELLASGAEPRVVIAVRLHAALMAIRSGHYVIHLAYERKGFGAFEDLCLPEYCHNVNTFDPEKVAAQARELLASASARRHYDAQLSTAIEAASVSRSNLVNTIRVMGS